jgi:hypothetical protein
MIEDVVLRREDISRAAASTPAFACPSSSGSRHEPRSPHCSGCNAGGRLVRVRSGRCADARTPHRRPREARRSPGAAAPLAAADSRCAGSPARPVPCRRRGRGPRSLFAAHSFRPPPAPDKVPVRTAKPPPVPMAPPLAVPLPGASGGSGRHHGFPVPGRPHAGPRAPAICSDSQYRVESVSACAVTFLFEPLKQRQTLTIGSAQ